MMGVIPPETLVCAKSLQEEQIQFKQNSTSLNNALQGTNKGFFDDLRMNFRKLELFPSNYCMPSKNTNLTMNRNIKKLSHT